MFGTKEVAGGNHQLNGLLEQGCEFEGKLTFEGTVRINGRFKGEIFSAGTLMVGEEAEVEGTIEVGTLVVHGRVDGDITTKERIEMHRPASVRGNIESKTLVIEEGVLFEGSCRMGGPVAVSLPPQQDEARELFAGPEEEETERLAEGSSF